MNFPRDIHIYYFPIPVILSVAVHIYLRTIRSDDLLVIGGKPEIHLRRKK